MTAEELQVLSDASDDQVEGAADFETGSHDKGMQTGPLPDNLVEDGNSGYQPSSEGLMVKETTRRSKGKTAEQRPDEPASKKSKRKATGGEAQAATDQDAGASQTKKKKRRLKKKSAVEPDQEHLDDPDQSENLADPVAEEASHQEGVPTKEPDLVDLSADEETPKESLPFSPKIRIIAGKRTVKEGDTGLGKPLISSALMDSILLPKDMEEYLKHSSQALMNRLTELSYESNVIRAVTLHRAEFIEKRTSTREEHIKKLEEAGNKAAQLITSQAKKVESLEASEKGLKAEVADLNAKLAAEETGKVLLIAEKGRLSKAKQLAESTLDTFKQEAILERSALEKTKAELEATLEAMRADLKTAQEASKINFKKGKDWKDTAARRGDFIGELLSKLRDSMTDEQLILAEQIAQDNNMNLAHLIERSLRRKSLPPNPSKPTDGAGSASEVPKKITDSSGGPVLSDASVMP